MDISISLELIVFIAVFIVQLILAVTAWLDQRKVHRDYHRPLGGQVNVVELMAKYSRIHSPVDVKVNANIHLPAQAHKGLLLINRNFVYKTELYPTLFALYQIVKSKHEFKHLQTLRNLQIVLFVGELILFGIGAFAAPPILGGAAAIAIVLILIGIFIELELRDLLNHTLDIAIDLLNLDDYETALAADMLDKLRGQGLDYPLGAMQTAIGFFSPRL